VIDPADHDRPLNSDAPYVCRTCAARKCASNESRATHELEPKRKKGSLGTANGSRPCTCSSPDERDSKTHLLSGKSPLQIFCGACYGYNFLIDKFSGPSISLSGRGFSRSGPEDHQVVCSVNAFLCMSYAHEGVWAGAAPEAVDPQPTTEAAEPQPTVPSTGGFSDAKPDALTPEEMQVAIDDDRLTDKQLNRALTAFGDEATVNAKQVHARVPRLQKRYLASRSTVHPSPVAPITLLAFSPPPRSRL